MIITLYTEDSQPYCPLHATINNDMLISVIVSTYNNYDALALVLDSLARQDDANFEVIIADDGSAEECKSLTSQCAERQHYDCRHIWHEDKGFRCATIRNLGVRSAKGDYLIFLDGDCIVRKDFITQHRKFSEKGWFISGKRIELSQNFTRKVISEKTPVQNWQFYQWLLPRLRKDINRLHLLLPIFSDTLFLGRRKYLSQGARGCNLAIFSEDFYAVNGFDEAFNHWGLEDTECITRLLNLGIKHKRVRYGVLAYHLWHPIYSKEINVKNKTLLRRTLRENRTYTKNGIRPSK